MEDQLLFPSSNQATRKLQRNKDHKNNELRLENIRSICLEMDRDETYCDTELSLWFGGSSASCRSSAININTAKASSRSCRSKIFYQKKQMKKSTQLMTIVYGDRVCFYDATDIQARAIINMAQRIEMDKSMKLSSTSMSRNGSSSPSPTPSLTPHKPQMQISELSMKRSLQRFLEERKTRIVKFKLLLT